MKHNIKLLILIFIVTMVGVCSVFTLSGCDNDEPRDVILEVINPNTGEILQWDDHINYPGKNTLIEVRIKDKKTGVYLTDDDFPDNTIRGCLTFYLSRINEDGSYDHHLDVKGEGYFDELGRWHVPPYGVWPQNDQYKSNHYSLSLSFDCKPKNLQQSNYIRKYKMCTDSAGHFYID